MRDRWTVHLCLNWKKVFPLIYLVVMRMKIIVHGGRMRKLEKMQCPHRHDCMHCGFAIVATQTTFIRSLQHKRSFSALVVPKFSRESAQLLMKHQRQRHAKQTEAVEKRTKQSPQRRKRANEHPVIDKLFLCFISSFLFQNLYIIVPNSHPIRYGVSSLHVS